MLGLCTARTILFYWPGCKQAEETAVMGELSFVTPGYYFYTSTYQLQIQLTHTHTEPSGGEWVWLGFSPAQKILLYQYTIISYSYRWAVRVSAD